MTSIRRTVESMAPYPISHQVMMSMLHDYANPNDKVHDLIRKNILQPVKRGLYIAGPAASSIQPEPMLLANHIIGPSYVTAESALAWYGLIPERVFSTVSATTMRGGTVDTPAGIFAYHHLPLPWYSYGILSLNLGRNQYAMVASQEKALFDKIIFTSGLRIRNRKQAIDYLLENLRMDEIALQKFNVKVAKTWLNDAPKAESLINIIDFVQTL